MKRGLVVLALCAVAASAPATAEPAIYRCGSSYSHLPCPDGKAVDVSDPRSPAERAAARTLATKNRHEASRLEMERRDEELKQRPAVASGFDSRSVPAAPSASAVRKGKAGKPAKRIAATAADDDFFATAPADRKSRKQGKAAPPADTAR